MNRKAMVWGAAIAVAAALAYLACGTTSITPPPCFSCLPDAAFDAGFDAGFHGGPDLDAGVDAGADAGTDAGVGEDGGVDGGVDGGADAGLPVPPWPDVPVMNYSKTYNIDYAQSAGIDDAYNVWLLKGDSIGVLRPGDAKPTWTSGVGQAASGALQSGSTVICGGSAGHAYVGYKTSDGPNYHTSASDPEYQQGDMDLVQVDANGMVSLTTHLGKTTSSYTTIGMRNTNDWHYDEDRSVWTCFKVTSGKLKGDVFLGTNHGVTMVQGDRYNSHIHPYWTAADGTKMLGYTYAVSVTPNGDVFIGNAWMFGLAHIDGVLEHFDRMQDYTVFRMFGWIDQLGAPTPTTFTNYRGVAQTQDGRYWIGCDFGLWEALWKQRTDSVLIDGSGYQRVSQISSSVTALAATDDGSLFVGTSGSGLYRKLPDDTIERIPGVSASAVQQLVYDDSGSPSMLLVLTDNGLYVLRGY